MERQRLGQAAEVAAVAFLQAHGLSVLLRNFRRRLGELDIVARDGDTVVIAEVRTRASRRFGGAAASVDVRKQNKLVRTTALFLQQRKDLATLRVRFDVIAVHDPLSRNPRIEWIKNAFTA